MHCRNDDCGEFAERSFSRKWTQKTSQLPSLSPVYPQCLFFHSKSSAPIGCTFHQLAEAEYYWTPPFARLRFVLWWKLIIQLKLESTFPIGYHGLHILCHYWTACEETKGGLCGAQNKTASAIGWKILRQFLPLVQRKCLLLLHCKPSLIYKFPQKL